jgi:hypothetical protein
MDDSARYLDALFIKGLTPRGHDRSFTQVKRFLKDPLHCMHGFGNPVAKMSLYLY